MAETFICGGALAAPVTLTAGSHLPRWPAASALLTPSDTDGSITDARQQAAAEAVLADATHLSLHTGDPGTTGADEVAELRVEATAAWGTGAMRTAAQVDGSAATATVTVTHWGAWKVTA